MAYVSVPKDLTHVKSKMLFGLTKRQIVCFGAALLMGLPLFFMLRGSVPTSAAALVMIFAMLPGLLFGLYEKHGQPLEVVIGQIVRGRSLILLQVLIFCIIIGVTKAARSDHFGNQRLDCTICSHRMQRNILVPISILPQALF